MFSNELLDRYKKLIKIYNILFANILNHKNIYSEILNKQELTHYLTKLQTPFCVFIRMCPEKRQSALLT